ncbi:MAG: threonylcarbamoyl-AMP synthase [Gammaproteobacteria bacterium]|nr:threonylcarbamoyl-AMP synthase [Gammaproteobacteria bacterium]
MLFLTLHPDNPQARLINQLVSVIRDGGVIAYPTDSCYALGCHIGDKDALDRIRSIRQLDDHHNFTLVCQDLSELATYARVGNSEFRLLKGCTPGPYTFILTATKEVPRRLQHPKRKTIGLRVPEHPITQALLQALAEPLMSVTLILPGDQLPMTDAEEIRERIGKQVDVIIDGGPCSHEPTSVIDLTGEAPLVIRHGRGEVAFLQR